MMLMNLTIPTLRQLITAFRPCCFHLPNTFRECMFVWDPSLHGFPASRLHCFTASRLHVKGRSLGPWQIFLKVWH